MVMRLSLLLLASTTPVRCIVNAQETNLEFATGRLRLFEALPYDLSALTAQGREAYEMIYAGRGQVHLELSMVSGCFMGTCTPCTSRDEVDGATPRAL